MKKKEYLQQYYYLDKLVKAKIEEIEKLESMLIYKSPQFKDTGGSSSTVSSDERLCKLIDLKCELEKEINSMIESKNKISQKINSISNIKYKTILTLRYINFKSFEEIAVSMNYSYRQVTRLHGFALDNLKDVL